MMMMSRRFLVIGSRGNVRLNSSITESLETYIEVLLRRYESVSEEASSMEADNSQSALLRRGREMKFLSPVYELQKRRKECKEELESIEEMLAELSKNEEDRELGELLLQDRETYETDLSRVESDLLKRLVPVDSADDCDAILEVQAGAGGTEASLFTQEIFDMYRHYAQRKQWKFEVMEMSQSDGGGVSKASAIVSGSFGGYDESSMESGVYVENLVLFFIFF